MNEVISKLLRLSVAVFLLCPLAGARASDLKDGLTLLWAGDGITLGQSGPFDHSAHFSVATLLGLDELNDELAAAGAGLFSLNSTVSGFTFDLERGVPVRTSESLGPLVAERATTLGKGKLNLAFSYTRIDFKQFEGKDLDSLSLRFVHDDTIADGHLGAPPPFANFELDEIHVDLDIDIVEDVYAFYATYGWSWKLDVGVVVPVVRVDADVRAVGRIIDNGGGGIHFFDPVMADQPRSRQSGDATGIGDILLRTKYNLVEDRASLPDMAIRGQVTLPTGDEDDLLGTGESQFQLLYVASKAYGSLTPHLNLGYTYVPGDSELNHLRYVLGTDMRLLPKITGALSVLGRWEPTGDGVGDHTIDVALGLKWELPRAFLLSAYAIVPLNINEGLRPAVAWTVGFESTF